MLRFLGIYVFALFLIIPRISDAEDSSASYPENIPAPRYTPGDWWLLKNKKGAEWTLMIQDTTSEKIIVVNKRSGRESTYTPDFNKMRGPLNGYQVEYVPHNRNFDFPLRPGKNWQGQSEIRSESFSDTLTVKGSAEKWEVIRLTINGQEQMFLSLRIRYEHKTGVHTNQSLCWYVPEIRYLAKCESDDTGFSYQIINYGTR